jgi:prevent-host-death family protein
MTITTLTAREFNQDRARAKRAARLGPVIVTERGKPELVLMSFEEYRKLGRKRQTLAEALYDPLAADIELELPPRSRESSLRIPDFD